MKARTVFVGAVVLVAIGSAVAGLKLFVGSFVTYGEDVPWANGYHLVGRVEGAEGLPPRGTFVFLASRVIGVVTADPPRVPGEVTLQVSREVRIPGDSRFELRRIGDRPAIVIVPGKSTSLRFRPWEEVRIKPAAEALAP